MRRLLIFAIVLLQAWMFAAPAEAGQRIALVVGNSDYQNAPYLPNPVNDAADVAAAFERLGFSAKLIRNGSFDSMRRGLLDFAQQAQSADIAVLYFAGHGMEIRDENWLIPVDAELRMDVSASQEAVSLGSIMPIVSKARKLGLVILDACRDNPFSRQLQVSQPGRALASRGLISVEPPNSVLVAFAAKHGTTADDGSGRNSPFTTALLHNLEIPGLEINYLFRNIHDEVYSATQQRQEPYVYGTLSREPIYLKPAASMTATAPAEAAQTTESRKDQAAPAKPDDRAPVAPADTKPAPQTATLEPQKEAAAAPASSLPANLAALSGRWKWSANCGMAKWNGTVDQEVSPDGKFTGRRSDGDLIEGRISGNSVSARHRVDGGIQQVQLRLIVAANGHHRLEGSFTDSRLPFGSCPYSATKI